MYFRRINYHFLFLYFIIFNILVGCQLQEPYKNHGIVFLENRSKKLILNNSNQNDAKKILGEPHTRSINNENEWIYIERVLTKGDFHKLGQNILEANNVLVLNFDKYGVLKKKEFYNKNDIQKVTFSDKETVNELSQKSFVERFLSSIREKMYRDKK